MEKYADSMQKMQRGDTEAFEKNFAFACPKFLTPAEPDWAEEPRTNHHQDAYRLQLKLFLHEVSQQVLLPTIRSYLKLYTIMAVPKLAAFLEMDEGQFRTLILCYKHKTRFVSPR